MASAITSHAANAFLWNNNNTSWKFWKDESFIPVQTIAHVFVCLCKSLDKTEAHN